MSLQQYLISDIYFQQRLALESVHLYSANSVNYKEILMKF